MTLEAWIDARQAGGKYTFVRAEAISDSGLSAEAVNDDDYVWEVSGLRLVISVLGNTLGGALLLASMFVLPQLIAGFFV